MKRVVLQLLLGAFAFGDVAIHDHQLGHFSFRVSDRARDRLQYPPAPIFVPDAVIQLPAHTRAARLARRFQHLESVVGM